MTKVVPTMVSNKPTMRPRCRGGANSATTASASTQRRPEAAPAMKSNRNQAGSQLVNRKPEVDTTGIAAASQSVGRRPSRCVMAEAKGVITNTPTQAAGREQTGHGGGHTVALEPQQQQRQQHEIAHQLEEGGAEDGRQTQPGVRWGRSGQGVAAVAGGQRVFAHGFAFAASTACATSAKPAPRSC